MAVGDTCVSVCLCVAPILSWPSQSLPHRENQIARLERWADERAQGRASNGEQREGLSRDKEKEGEIQSREGERRGGNELKEANRAERKKSLIFL